LSTSLLTKFGFFYICPFGVSEESYHAASNIYSLLHTLLESREQHFCLRGWWRWIAYVCTWEWYIIIVWARIAVCILSSNRCMNCLLLWSGCKNGEGQKNLKDRERKGSVRNTINNIMLNIDFPNFKLIVFDILTRKLWRFPNYLLSFFSWISWSFSLIYTSGPSFAKFSSLLETPRLFYSSQHFRLLLFLMDLEALFFSCLEEQLLYFIGLLILFRTSRI
jgi:hypothetical protein